MLDDVIIPKGQIFAVPARSPGKRNAVSNLGKKGLRAYRVRPMALSREELVLLKAKYPGATYRPHQGTQEINRRLLRLEAAQ